MLLKSLFALLCFMPAFLQSSYSPKNENENPIPLLEKSNRYLIHSLNSINASLQRLKKKCGIESVYFVRIVNTNTFVRALSTFTEPSLAVGTLLTNPTITSKLVNGQTVILSETIYGLPYVALIVPLYDSKGYIYGAAHVGAWSSYCLSHPGACAF